MCKTLAAVPLAPACITAVKRPPVSPNKKRVRFESSDSEERPSKRLRLLVPLLSAEEKSDLWYRPEEREVFRREALAEAQECRRRDNKMILKGQAHFCFRETYSNVFTVCNLNVDDDDICEVASPEVITFMASSQGRGLEDRTVPRVTVERRWLRLQQTKMVLQAQGDANGNAETIRSIASVLSKSSRKFAETMGLVDATAAMMVYSGLDADASSSDAVSVASSEVEQISLKLVHNKVAAEAAE